MTQTILAVLALVVAGLWYSWKLTTGANDRRQAHLADPRPLLTPVVYVALIILGAVLALLWWN